MAIKSLSPRAGDAISVPPIGVTCIVGPNNVGKSQALRDITNLLHGVSADPVIIDRIDVERKTATPDDVLNYLEDTCVPVETQLPGQRRLYKTPNGYDTTVQDFLETWNNERPYLLQFAGMVSWHSPAGGLVNEAAMSLPLYTADPVHPVPLYQLMRDGALERELSDVSNAAFGKPLTMDRVNLGGPLLRMGQTSVSRPAYNDASRAYGRALEQLPPLSIQGEGIKSFLGLAIRVLAGKEQILLVDEPEAFLHPAQARALGRWVARQALERERQVILATHDRDIVSGLIDSDASIPVMMLRISRDDGDNSQIRTLSVEDVRDLWRDPVLRYSNLLQGLFHSRVVICEGDADCRFYSAVLDHHYGGREGQAEVDNTLFVPSGGVSRMPTMADALTHIGVNTWAITDFDALSDKRAVKRLVVALGGEWTGAIESNYSVLLDYVNGQPGAWEPTKHLGLSALPAGDPYKAAQRLLSALAEQQVLVLEVGEMEDLDKTVGLHAAGWVNAVLDKRGHEAESQISKLLGQILADCLH